MNTGQTQEKIVKLEVGKTYVSKHGQTYRCLATDRPNTTAACIAMNLKTGSLHMFDESGKRDSRDTDNDLIEECHPFHALPVDTPIWVRDEGGEWTPRHFAKVEDGKIYTWAKGCTSHTAYACHPSIPLTRWDKAIELAEVDNEDHAG